MPQSANDFNSIRISLASSDQMKMWSYGEVTKPETINYRTLRPEKDGLFCERIFGPTRDWECYCGKYKKIRFKGVICDRCGVEVARSKVRRERMGHIQLAAPVAHIWYSKATPNRPGLILDISPRNLDRVIYFAQYLITSVDEDLRKLSIENLQKKLDEGIEKLELDSKSQIDSLSETETVEVSESEDLESKTEEISESEDLNELSQLNVNQINEKLEADKTAFEKMILDEIDEVESISIGQLLTEEKYRVFKEKHGPVFSANMGAEAVLDVLKAVDLDILKNTLQEEMRSTSGQRRKKVIKRLRIVEAFRKSGNKPEQMMLSVLPVLPPELRPMVQLDGGRFATSDLNDLYRRVINRNNRLLRLIELKAPEIIIRNEKRMLQEAVDALIDNGRRGRAVSGSHNHRLKALSDLLRGKQGRFRQNLLGKRVDYSGRSVIIAGPELKMHQCGLPRKMALELFKPFVMNQLVMLGYAHNIKSAKRIAEAVKPEVWDILEEVVQNRPVLLNRAPTLHRLGIQAFEVVLIDGNAIQVHPLACTAFNADFDGDQMAVHLPLSPEAVLEAQRIMLSTKNMLSPSSGEPIVAPTLDIVLGCFYLTTIDDNLDIHKSPFANFEDALMAFDREVINLRTSIKVRNMNLESDDKFIQTSVGRIIFNNILPEAIGFRNDAMDKTALKDLTSEVHRLFGNEETQKMLDEIKRIGFHYAGQSGITIAINDIEILPQKEQIIKDAENKILTLDDYFNNGLITEDERYLNTVQVWTQANDDLTKIIEENLHNYGGMYVMATSGARGNIAQIKQMAGMRGLMSDPKGRIIGRPIKSSFREGLSVLEYFISTHGARKGLADTALRTADSGYLTRRLIDVAQEIIVLEEDCETSDSLWISSVKTESLGISFGEKIKSRMLASPVGDPETGEIIFERNHEISDEVVNKLEELSVEGVFVRSPLTCQAERGICRMCYGIALASMKLVLLGEAVGIIAAQSIGEPGTQLTMRTFHTGGIAGVDITSGLPRVEELFETRSPRGEAVLSEIDGIAYVTDVSEGRSIRVVNLEEYQDDYEIPKGYKALVTDDEIVSIGTVLAVDAPKGKNVDLDNFDGGEIIARVSGKVKINKKKVRISWSDEDEREYLIPAAAQILVKDLEPVVAGQSLTAGPKNPQHILRIQGRDSVQKYLIEEVQQVYRAQGVAIHDKHIEIIVSQMLRKVRVDSPGDTDLLPGELIDRRGYEEKNASILAEGGEPATANTAMLGITRASLNMDSVLAAASFQETTRVLTEAAIAGESDSLRGLKENVIIGRLIPARFDLSEEGREKLGIKYLESLDEQTEDSELNIEGDSGGSIKDEYQTESNLLDSLISED
ncbi:MAG: DNA-directed RNA polymerase subunit beta' [Dehalococcoidia bacterium]